MPCWQYVSAATSTTGSKRNGTGASRWLASLCRATFASGTGTITSCRLAGSAEAVEAMEWGLQEDPLNLLYRHLLARGLRLAGRLDHAEAELRAVLEIDENYPHALATLGSICAQQGRFEEALTVTRKANAAMPWSNPVIGQLAALLVRTGAASQAETLLEGLRPGTAWGAPAGMAVFHAMSGEFDRASEWAERAIDSRFPALIPILRPLMGQSPEWRALARMMNLPEAV